MLTLLLAIQVTANDSGYSSAALRELVAQAADVNRVIPESLATYGARVESDVAILFRGANGTERVTQIEQIASELWWFSSAGVEQHIIGYRTSAQPTAGSSSLAVSALTILRRPWIVPTLSGNRFRLLLVWRNGSITPNGRTTVEVVHPLAQDRDTFYRFDGADTVSLTLPDGRSIDVVRLRVRPETAAATQDLLFKGTLDLDLVGHHVVRLRGQLVSAGTSSSAWTRLVRKGLQTIAWAELINDEAGGRWLPIYQRIEVQGVSPLAKDFRPVFRIVSRFRSQSLGDDTPPHRVATTPTSDRAERSDERLVVASRDSLGQFSEWIDEMGAATTSAASDAFDDPRSDMKPTDGTQAVDSSKSRKAHSVPPIVRVYAEMLERFQSHAPAGLTVKADAGQVWSDPMARAALTLQWRRSRWLSSIRAQQTLVRTNGLLPTLGSEPWVFSLNLAHEDGRALGYRTSALSFTRALGSTGALLHIATGLASDRPESIGIRLSPAYSPADSTRSASSFGIPNLQSSVTLELHPNVRAELPTSGMGAGLAYERRDGDLRWQRTVGWLLARRTGSRMTYTARMDGAAVMSWRSPPQAFFQIAPSEQISTSSYWESSSRRAALLRLSASYRLLETGSSLQSLHWLYLPSASPSIGIGVQSQWNDGVIATRAPSAASLRQMKSMVLTTGSIDANQGAVIPRHGNAIRTTVSAIVRPFGGAVGFGIGRSIDGGSRWTFSFVTDPWW